MPFGLRPLRGKWPAGQVGTVFVTDCFEMEGFLWGWHGECEKQTDGVGQGAEGRNCFGKPCFLEFFRTSFNYSDTPEGEQNEGMAEDGLGALNIKKEPAERIPLARFESLFE